MRQSSFGASILMKITCWSCLIHGTALAEREATT